MTGPNTVIDAVAAGKKAARSIDLFLSGRQLVTSAIPKIPNVYIEPPVISELDEQTNTRVEPETLKPSERIKNFKEVTMTLPENPARAECRRCLRCDLEFTRRISTDQPDITATRGAHYG